MSVTHDDTLSAEIAQLGGLGLGALRDLWRQRLGSPPRFASTEVTRLWLAWELQAQAGWKLVKTAYDDGGLSGGSMERPALQRLLADVAAGRINVIVVYKVDRLTRSLADFARIVETLDNQGASFVSITQQFNTTT